MKIIEINNNKTQFIEFYKNHQQEFYGLIFLVLFTLFFCFTFFKTKIDNNYIKYEELDNHERIQELIKKILDITQASRVLVVLVHNTSNIDAVEFKEFSVVYEALQINIPSLRKLIKRIPITECFINKEIKHLNDFKFHKYYIGQPNLSLACSNYLKRKELNTKYSRLLTNKNGIFGLIEIQYIQQPTIDLYNNIPLLNKLEEYYSNLKILLKKGNLDTVIL